MTQQEQVQNFRDKNPDSIWGFGFYNSEIEQALLNNPYNGIRVVFGLDENGNQTAYLEPASLPQMKSAGGTGALPCPTFCS